MSTFDYVKNWERENQDVISKYVIDDENLLKGAKGKKKGVYLVSVKLMKENVSIPMYVGEAGADEAHDRSIRDRLTEHLRIWLRKKETTEYWTGIRREELGSFVKFSLHFVDEEEDREARRKKEAETINRTQPYLQYSPYKKYNSPYEGIDLCIIPWNGTRRKSFLDRLEQKGILPAVDAPHLVNNVIKEGIDWENIKIDWENIDWKVCAKAAKTVKGDDSIACILEEKFGVGSDEYKGIKKVVDSALGFSKESRGCTHPYIIKLLEHVIKYYYPEMSAITG